MSDTTSQPKLSSFAQPTDEDIAVFEALSDSEKRELIESRLTLGLEGEGRKLKPQDIIDAVLARRRNGRV